MQCSSQEPGTLALRSMPAGRDEAVRAERAKHHKDEVHEAHRAAHQPLMVRLWCAPAHRSSERWYGRCAVPHDDQGVPREIYFWGWSGG